MIVLNFIDKTVSKLKNILIITMSALAGLHFLKYLFELINIAVSNANAMNVIVLLLKAIVHLAILVFGLVALIKKEEKKFKTFFVVYFGYLFIWILLGLFDYFAFLSYNDAFFVIFGIFGFIMDGSLCVIGLLFLSEHIKGGNKYDKAIKVLYVVFLCAAFVMLIFDIVGAAISRFEWYSFVTVLIEVAAASLFVGCYCAKNDGNGSESLTDSDGTPSEEEEIKVLKRD